jgi:hypothetical protein
MTRYRKFGSVMTVVDGIKFRSKAEAHRYGELKLLEKAGRIRHLELQPAFPLTAHGRKLATYVADFSYEKPQIAEGGVVLWTRIIEDVKGMLTPMYRLKKKWAELQYGITITEVRK